MLLFSLPASQALTFCENDVRGGAGRPMRSGSLAVASAQGELIKVVPLKGKTWGIS